MSLLPKGLWPVMITPFKPNNQIDIDGLERLTNMYVYSNIYIQHIIR